MSKEEIKELKKGSPVGSIFDFSDKFSPMLVKELRQGIRSIGFAGAFITLQAILSVILFLMIFDTNQSDPSLISATIFYTFAIAVCGLQPLRGANAIASEVGGDTIDLPLEYRCYYGRHQ